ncbi:hypothetical protein ACFX13_013806 [Malus domestica]
MAATTGEGLKGLNSTTFLCGGKRSQALLSAATVGSKVGGASPTPKRFIVVALRQISLGTRRLKAVATLSTLSGLMAPAFPTPPYQNPPPKLPSSPLSPPPPEPAASSVSSSTSLTRAPMSSAGLSTTTSASRTPSSSDAERRREELSFCADTMVGSRRA